MNYKFEVQRSLEASNRFISDIDENIEDNRDYDYRDYNTASVIQYGVGEPGRSRTGVKVDLDRLHELFPEDIPDLILDLAEIAATTYAVDKEVNREVAINNDTGKGRVNTRNIKIQFPVLSQKLATQAAEDLISDMVSHSTRDIFKFEFRLSRPEASTPIPDPTRTDTSDAISLLSDGLDSTAGIHYNGTNDIDSSYVSVNYGSGVQTTVESIVNSTGVEHHLHRVNLQKSGNEFSQFSRGFMHLTFGLLSAIALDAETVYSFENGIAARFDVLQEGWLTTRTVSPHLLDQYNTFVDRVLDRQITFSNPFAYKTKTEIVEYIRDTDLVRETISCPHSTVYNDSEYDNCNLCVPCIFRAIALVNSNHDISFEELGVFNSFTTADFDSYNFPKNGQVKQKYSEVEETRGNMLKQQANSPETYLEAIAELSYFSKLILTNDKTTVVQEYSKLYSDEVYDLHRRFAENFVKAMNEFQEANPTIEALYL